MSSNVAPVSTGISALDEAMGGLMVGDNVVWVGDGHAPHDQLEAAFLSAGIGPKALIVMNGDPGPVPADVTVLDARPGCPHADVVLLESEILHWGAQPGARLVVRDLDTLVRRLGADRAFGFFTRTCPRLFDIGAFAYWRASRTGSGTILDAVQRATQCVIEIDGSRMRFRKAEGRPGMSGRIFDVTHAGGDLTLTEVRALSRLAEGMRRIRLERGLTQTDVARLAGVSPSAISQAESGRRGLALDTLLTLSDALGVSLDDLLDHHPDEGYVVARRDRIPARRGVIPLLDDPAAGLRAYLVNLGPGESGGPATVHKGAELVMVGQGLVQIDLAVEAPVMRPGDALLVTKDAISGWRNLLPEPARLFWIVRD